MRYFLLTKNGIFELKIKLSQNINWRWNFSKQKCSTRRTSFLSGHAITQLKIWTLSSVLKITLSKQKLRHGFFFNSWEFLSKGGKWRWNCFTEILYSTQNRWFFSEHGTSSAEKQIFTSWNTFWRIQRRSFLTRHGLF